MPLNELLETYIANRPGMTRNSADQYLYTLKAFEKFLERPATLGDLDEDLVTRYTAMRLQKWSQSAAKRDRNSLVVWWRFAAKRKLIEPPAVGGRPGCQSCP